MKVNLSGPEAMPLQRQVRRSSCSDSMRGGQAGSEIANHSQYEAFHADGSRELRSSQFLHVFVREPCRPPAGDSDIDACSPDPEFLGVGCRDIARPPRHFLAGEQDARAGRKTRTGRRPAGCRDVTEGPDTRDARASSMSSRGMKNGSPNGPTT